MSPGPEPYDVIVIGAGAAGMMCALTAGRRGRRVALLEHNDRPGKKIGISGGGRCNFTNLHASPENYLSGHPAFCRSALARYTPQDFLALVEKHGIAWHEKKLGQLFCDTSSRAIIEMLVRECRESRVEILCGEPVLDVRKTDRFHVRTRTRETSAASLVIATGGLSFEKLGASPFGHRIAEQFGLPMTGLRPALVPLTFDAEDRTHFDALSGVSLPVIVRRPGISFAENILFTHRGMSGPAILQISSYWREGDRVEFDLLPGIDLWQAPTAKTSLENLLSGHWPRRLADAWCARHAPRKPLAQYRQYEITDVARRLHHWEIAFSGTEGYPKAEVTLGGVDTGALSSKTMEARDVPGLYFIGEVVDVTGWLGGYNFQWAWASGNAAGLVV
ncbi:MAG TPA: NAD(P)/FAD-dependent oxidoreductase [Terrimicrobiaceae bacterium]|mgnify:CR=1 FL=1|nr:NAD(P)/FAD-dependent oxidoreductase [Terrimicrobiaceae bacterium]